MGIKTITQLIDRINSDIVINGARAISASIMNDILSGSADILAGLSSSYVNSSSSFDSRINNVTPTGFVTTASFNTFTASVTRDSASFNSRINSISGSGGGVSTFPSGVFDTGTGSYALLAGVVRPTFNTASSTNVWDWIQDSQHTYTNISASIVTATDKITVYFSASYDKILTFMVTPDETTSTTAFTSSANNKYGGGGYTMGSRVLNNSAEIYFSKKGSSSVLISYNGSVWSVSSGGLFNYFGNAGSPAWAVTWTNGRLRVQNIPFDMKSYPKVTMYGINGDANLIRYVPSVEAITNQWFDCYFWDMANNQKYTASAPIANFGIYVDMGMFDTRVNPQIEDFGLNSNFWTIGIMRKSL